ncbi:hypothetical protein L208DRAFT_1378062 [Tricholoma matsutake]|nr:hypothetical protein L208DRAFT_1378062 [Tricholoma matsutake 945]
MTSMDQPSELEQAGNLKCSAVFVEEVARTEGFFPCAVCAHTLGLHKLQLASLVDLTACGSLEPLPDKQDGIQSVRVCGECLHQLRGGHMPLAALNGSHNIGIIPNALQGLTFLETLYIALCLPLNTLLLKDCNIQCILLLDWQLKTSKMLPSLQRLTIQRAHVEEAVNWLQSKNPFYEDIALDDKRLQLLPEDGVPEWIAQQVKDKTKRLPLNKVFNITKIMATFFQKLFTDGHVPFNLGSTGGA